MNALNKIGGALLLAGLAIAVIIGFQTPTGREFWDGIWQAGETVVQFIGDQLARLSGTGGRRQPLGLDRDRRDRVPGHHHARARGCAPAAGSRSSPSPSPRWPSCSTSPRSSPASAADGARAGRHRPGQVATRWPIPRSTCCRPSGRSSTSGGTGRCWPATRIQSLLLLVVGILRRPGRRRRRLRRAGRHLLLRVRGRAVGVEDRRLVRGEADRHRQAGAAADRHRDAQGGDHAAGQGHRPHLQPVRHRPDARLRAVRGGDRRPGPGAEHDRLRPASGAALHADLGAALRRRQGRAGGAGHHRPARRRGGDRAGRPGDAGAASRPGGAGGSADEPGPGPRPEPIRRCPGSTTSWPTGTRCWPTADDPDYSELRLRRLPRRPAATGRTGTGASPSRTSTIRPGRRGSRDAVGGDELFDDDRYRAAGPDRRAAAASTSRGAATPVGAATPGPQSRRRRRPRAAADDSPPVAADPADD